MIIAENAQLFLNSTLSSPDTGRNERPALLILSFSNCRNVPIVFAAGVPANTSSFWGEHVFMARMPSASMKIYTSRFSPTAIALVAIACFSLTVVLMEESGDREDLDQLVISSMEVRLDSLSSVLDRQIQSGLLDEEVHQQLSQSFAGTAAIQWADYLPADWTANSNIITGGIDPNNRHFEISNTNLTEMMAAVNACGTAPVAMVPANEFTLTGCRLSDGDVFAALFYRPQIVVRTQRFMQNKWPAVTGLVLAAMIIAYLLSRRMLHGPIHRLSEALSDAEETLELKLDKPLPRNEIGWLGNRISSWLERLKSTQSELERVALVAEHTKNAVIVLDKEFYVEWVNDAFTLMSGFSPDDVMGKRPSSFQRGPDTNLETAAMVDKLIEEGRPATFEAQSHRKDGTTYWISSEIQPVKNEDGELTGWIAVTADITQRRETEIELASHVEDLEAARIKQDLLTTELEVARKAAESSNKSKSDFLADMSHEIRTPMNGVLGIADVLLTTELSASQRDYIQTIKDSGAALLTILNDILDLSKLETGKITLEKEAADTHRLFNSVCHLMGPRAREKGLELSVDIADEVPKHILEDGGRLRQVLLNLVGNAVKFTDQGSVRILASVPISGGKGRHLKIEVVDTGVGIAEETQATLFERYEQGGTAATASGGTGLGLAICRELTWLMGGEVRLESEVGKGSIFSFEIPFVAVEGKTAPENAKPATKVTATTKPVTEDASDIAASAPVLDPETLSKSLNILLAEDHPVNQSLMKAFVQKLGHTITIADDGVDTVKAIRAGDYDLVLMDVQMPRMDGVMATKVIRSLENAKAQIPIIAVTANAMAGQRDHYLQSGMNGYVSKPVQLVALEDEIQRVWEAFSDQGQQSVG